MRLLVLGGGIFLGRHVAEAALARGWDVTLFNRGRAGPGPLPGARSLVGDRDGDLTALAGDGGWDAVIDTCGYVPRVVRRSAEALRERTAHYTFVSSVSVYAEFGRSGDETAALASAPAPLGEAVTGESYGPLKAACEAVVADVYGSRALSVRPGLIVGPLDPSDRFTYWVRRLAAGGVALAPGDGSAKVQALDVRDLATLLLDTAAAKASGVMNATGPSVPLASVLDACRDAAGGVGAAAAELAWTAPAYLAAAGVEGWTQLPLWIPGVDQQISNARAVQAGLRCRDVVQTAAATLAWDRRRDQTQPLRAGLTAERERALLAAYPAWLAAQAAASGPGAAAST